MPVSFVAGSVMTLSGSRRAGTEICSPGSALAANGASLCRVLAVPVLTSEAEFVLQIG